MKKLIVLILALCLVLCAGCGEKSGIITQEEAEKIAIEKLGFAQKDVESVHVHAITYQDVACYSFHITVDGHSHEVIIDSVTGEVLHTGDSSH